MNSENEKKIYSLKRLADSLQTVISKNYNSKYWIKAEISKLNFYPHSGHAYPDLVEKKDNKIIAQQRAIIWASNYNRIQSQFQRVTGEQLGDDMEILFLTKVSYNPLYGLSLIIEDIDASFSLGQLAQEKNLTIEKLKKLNLFDRNKKLKFPVYQKILLLFLLKAVKDIAIF